jgi:alpha-N-arabinofuranosidase
MRLATQTFTPMTTRSLSLLVLFAAGSLLPVVRAQTTAPTPVAAPVMIQIDASKIAAHVSPMLYGLMTEEINYSYEGGLYGELVRNRTFQGKETTPDFWSLVQDAEGAGSMALDPSQPLNAALPVALKLEVTAAGAGKRVGIANPGFWGIPVQPETRYRASFYAKAAPGFTGPLTVSIESNDGATVQASAQVPALTTEWKRYAVNLITGKVTASATNRLVIAANAPGTVWFNVVSLFPPTWNDRPNGNRRDLMQLLADMKPALLRFPGGNYLQGRTLATRFDWKKTLGDIAQRPGHRNDAWNYWSTDGMGLLEFLLWCEDMNAQPVLGVFAGFTLRGVPTPAGPELQPFVQEALEEIEYVTGDTSTTWGARRAQDGHPAPFKLTYVEIGNEDFFDHNPGSYDGRFAQFFDAIKAKYPALKVIATTKVDGRTPDVVDDHFYTRAAQVFQSDAGHYDDTDRKGPKIFVGEYATRIGSPTPNMNAALGDAVYLIGMERNADVVIMSAYAPLFTNVNSGAMQWPTDLIGYDALTSYGSPSYYVQKMFSHNRGDVVLAGQAEGIATREWQPPTPRGGKEAPPPKQVPTLFYVATRDTPNGTIYLKLVNAVEAPQTVRVEIKGVATVAREGVATVLSSASPTDTNTIAEPTKIVPVTTRVTGLGTSFTRTLVPNSVTVLQLQTR